MGEWNSSVTRVRPLFRHILASDPTGPSWLPSLLQLAPRSAAYAVKLATQPGTLLPTVIKNGIEDASVERFFEYPTAPPTAFLRWLILHPERMVWPTTGGKRLTFGKATQEQRENLFGLHGPAARAHAEREALASLATMGAGRSARQWWAFEGFTSVDCRLETDGLLLFVEGKRTEKLSPSTSWYPQRNQLLRNLEAAQEAAGERDYAVLLIGEVAEDVPMQVCEASLPHLLPDDREDLLSHYLGAVLWRDLCAAVGVDYRSLPARNGDAATVRPAVAR